MSDAWSQRENEHPPVDDEKIKEIQITISFEYSSFDGHPSEWDWEKILKTKWAEVDEWNDVD
tara:strand:- start:198 stop:383 length:186 start_codon:yes stop_codon:yes gene_type:complete